MLIKKAPDIRPSEITDQTVYMNRRQFMRAAGAVATSSLLGAGVLAPRIAIAARKLPVAVKSPFSTDEEPNTYEDITTYNNYYEFGTGKGDPAPVYYHRGCVPRPNRRPDDDEVIVSAAQAYILIFGESAATEELVFSRIDSIADQS